MYLLLKSAFTKKNILKTISSILILLLIVNLQKRYSGFTPEIIQGYIISLGMFGPLISLGFALIRPLIFFPITIIYLASGLAFGGFWGGVIGISGALLSALTAHFVANKIGIDFLPMKWRSRICAVRDRVDEKGLRNMILIRFIPMISFDLISYSAGLSGVKLKPYLLGTLIGIAPRIFAYTYVGSNIMSPGDSNFWIALGVLILIFVIPGLVYKYKKRK
ncbi:MAG: TVP38/TMEM64 family protein [Clostridia bacterium]|nr:TVP38/TMEM64 family protein [Clostridia bacterium]